ncbi:5'-3' exonuclease [Jatrophihabitans telluris]|uniref:5'-3' exonuclease n=1 Tax=Jatrophihabitans telluris TaxID=2038343 RepID=A0ABY4R6C7_9ACTN|nr:5'-3' exonuclease [Jatrophihabitans telluris]UQX90300.1 5'-3' exonuclease [Jatrophihabitans telluris]
MLIDSASMYFRAFYGVPDSVKAPNGMPVNAVRGFTDMIATLITRYRPDRFVACLDYDWRPAFRVALVPSYKAHRVVAVTPAGQPDVEEVPDLLTPQVPILLAVLKAAGLCSLGVMGFEADDVIATLAHRYDQAGQAVDVVSGDRDLIGVVTDKVRLLYTGRGVAKLEELTPVAVQEKYGIPSALYPDFAVLRGDPSDGLPGVPGIGEKTAAIAVSKFGTIEQILALAVTGEESMSPTIRTKVLKAQEYLQVAPDVVRGRTDLDVGEVDDRLPGPDADPEMLDALGSEFGLGSSIDRLRTALAGLR